MGNWMKGKFTPKNPQKYRGDLDKIVFRSAWERNLMNWLDLTPDILAWESEQTIIPYFDPIKNKNRRYFCDFKAAVKQFDGSVKVILIEIKPYKQTIKPRVGNKSQKTLTEEHITWITNQAKWAAAREVCKNKGWEFVIITEKVLFAGIDKTFKPKKKPTPRSQKP